MGEKEYKNLINVAIDAGQANPAGDTTNRTTIIISGYEDGNNDIHIIHKDENLPLVDGDKLIKLLQNTIKFLEKSE